MNNGNMPAMPLALDIRADEYGHQEVNDAYEGLTKREMIAMYAMQGYISGMTAWSDGIDGGGVQLSAEEAAQEAVNYADALLKQLEDSNNGN